MFRCGCCPLRRCGYVFRHRWSSMHPRHGCVPKWGQAHSRILYRAAEHPRWPQDRAYGQLPQRGHHSRNTLSSVCCRLISNHYLRCRCVCQGLCRRFQTSPCLLRHRRRTYSKLSQIGRSQRISHTRLFELSDHRYAQQYPLSFCRWNTHANERKNLNSKFGSSYGYTRRGQRCCHFC